MGQSMDQAKFVIPFKKFEGVWSAKADHSFKFFKGCLPQFLLGPFLNTLSQILL